MSKTDSEILKEEIQELIGIKEENDIEKDKTFKNFKLKYIVKFDRKKHINNIEQYYLEYINKNRKELKNSLSTLKEELEIKIKDNITIYLNYGNDGGKLDNDDDNENEDDEIEKTIKIRDNLDKLNIKELLNMSEIYKNRVGIVDEDLDLLIMLNITQNDDINDYLNNQYETPENLHDLLAKVGYNYQEYEDYLKGYYYNNRNNPELINEFYENLTDQRKKIITFIKTAYGNYLDKTGFNALDEKTTYKFCLFQTNNYKKYPFMNLLKTWHHYKNLDIVSEQKDSEQKGGADEDNANSSPDSEEDEENEENEEDNSNSSSESEEDEENKEENKEENEEEKAARKERKATRKAARKASRKKKKAERKAVRKAERKAERKAIKKETKKNKLEWKESISINMLDYVTKRKKHMEDVLDLPNLIENFGKEMKITDSDLTNMSVDHPLFHDFMNYYFKKHDTGDRYYQKILELYMSYHGYVGNTAMKSRGLLVNHGLGTGKTRTAINIIKGCFYNFNKGWENIDKKHLKSIFIFIPASLRYDPWTQHLTNKDTRPFETIDTEYDLPLHNIYIVHYNGVGNINKFLNTVTDPILDNSLIIIDETHNITNGLPKLTENEYGEMGKLYLKLLNNKSDRLKILCLTGTPILNYTMEYLYIMKLVKGKKDFVDKLKLTYPDSFTSNESEQIQIDTFFVTFNGIFEDSLFFNETSIELRNKIDMLTFENRESIIPYIKDHQFELTTTIEEFTKWKDTLINQINKVYSNDLIYIEKLKSLFSGLLSYYKGFDQSRINRQYLFIPLTDLQSDIVKEIRNEGIEMFQDMRSQLRAMQRAQEIGMTKGLAKNFQGIVSGLAMKGQDDDKRMRKSTRLREAENICYRRSGGKFPLMKGTFEELVSNKIENEEDDHKFTPSNMLNYSNKLSTLIVNIQKHEGCHLVYCKYQDIYGIKAIAKMLKDVLGFEEYRSSQLIYNQDPKPRYAIYNPSKQPMLVSDFNKSEAMINGEMVKGPNKLGEYIKVLLITDKAKEGVNFKSIQYEHIINPWWNVNIINQIIGRGIRINSHDYLKEAGLWNDDDHKVTVFYYTSTDKYFKTEDINIGIKSKIKFRANVNFYNTINSTAIDCIINSKENNNTCVPYDVNKIKELIKEDLDESFVFYKKKYTKNLTDNYTYIIDKYTDNNPDKYQHIGLIQDSVIEGSNIKRIAATDGLNDKLRNLKTVSILIVTCNHTTLRNNIQKMLVEFEYKNETITIDGSEIDYVIYEVSGIKKVDDPVIEYIDLRSNSNGKDIIKFDTYNIDLKIAIKCLKRLVNYNLFFICGIDILIKTNMKSDTKDKILNKINSNRSKKFLYKCAGGKDGVFMINDRIIYDKTMPKGKTKYYTNTLKLFNNIENIDDTYFVILLNNFEEDLFFVDKKLKDHQGVKKQILDIVNHGYLADIKVSSILDTVKELTHFTIVVPNSPNMANIKLEEPFKKKVYKEKYIFISK